MAAVDDRLVEAAARDAVGRALEPADPARVQRRERVADARARTSEADHAGDEQAPLDEVDARERSDERVAEQDDRPGSGDAAPRPRRSAASPRSTVPRAATRRSRRPQRDRVALDVADEVASRVAVGAASSRRSSDVVDDDPGVHDPPPVAATLLPRSADVGLGDRLATVRASCLELVELRVDERRLERRDDDQVDDRERAGDDERAARARAASRMPLTRARIIARGSGSRRRAR